MNTVRLICTFVACLVASTCWAQQADSPDPREKLSTAIPEMTKLIEKKEYETFLKTFVPPDDLKKITETVPLPQVAKGFGEHHAPRLLKALHAIKDLEPKMDAEGKIAVYKFKEPIDQKKEISFTKVDKFWYVRNQ